MEFKRHTLNDVANNRFYQLPKFLFEGEFKKALSAEAKLLYALLRDRHELSLQNGWVNKNNEVFLIFKREEMCEMLGCGMEKIRKLIKELSSIGLFEEERQGLNKPNLLYLNYINIEKSVSENDCKTFIDTECRKSTVRNNENRQSGVSKIDSQECRISTPNKTNINNTKINDTDTINLSAPAENFDVIDNDENTCFEDIKNNIEIKDEHIEKDIDYVAFNKQTIKLVKDILSSTECVRIGKQFISVDDVKQRFKQLNREHLRCVYDSIKKSKTTINNIRAYLITALYNAPVTFTSSSMLASNSISQETKESHSYDLDLLFRKSIKTNERMFC